MISECEQAVSRSMRSILARVPIGTDISNDEAFREVLTWLEGYVPTILSENHSEWERECLDGIYPYEARKTGDRQIEMFGPSVLISDQTLVPLHLRFQIAESTDEICWMECRIGGKGPRGMVRTPYELKLTLVKCWVKLNDLNERYTTFNWAYQVTFGDREV